MGNLVQGRNVLVSMFITDDYYPVFCAKSASLDIPQEELEVTHVNSGSWRQYIQSMNSGTLNVSGITTLDNSNGRVSITYLMQQSIRRQSFSLRVMLTDDDGNVLLITFPGFITNTSLSKDIGSYSGSNVTFRINGIPEFSEIIPPPEPPVCEVEDTLYLTLEEGEHIVQSDSLQGDYTVLWVTREGLGHDQALGSAGNRQFLYHPIVGNIEFSPLVPGNPGGEAIAVGYKRNT